MSRSWDCRNRRIRTTLIIRGSGGHEKGDQERRGDGEGEGEGDGGKDALKLWDSPDRERKKKGQQDKKSKKGGENNNEVVVSPLTPPAPTTKEEVSISVKEVFWMVADVGPAEINGLTSRYATYPPFPRVFWVSIRFRYTYCFRRGYRVAVLSTEDFSSSIKPMRVYW